MAPAACCGVRKRLGLGRNALAFWLNRFPDRPCGSHSGLVIAGAPFSHQARLGLGQISDQRRSHAERFVRQEDVHATSLNNRCREAIDQLPRPGNG